MNNLNEQQLKVVQYPVQPVIIMAGAGTGKTTILVNRIAYLINFYNISPNRILAITFTNKAANEMNDRIEKTINTRLNWIGTFHKICIRILSEEIQNLGRSNNFKIIDDEESLVILKTIYEDLKIDKEIIEKYKLSYKNVLNIIDKVKSNQYKINDLYKFDIQKSLKLDDQNKIELFVKIFELYEQKFFKCNYLDFNDIINLTNEILENFPDVQQKWCNKFDYILIDEFQDTNYSQFHLIEQLANSNFNVFAVGDEDQIIYTFRGADPLIVNKFLSNKENIEILKLEQNYRSTNQILDVANQLISHNRNRIDKKLFSLNNNHIKPMLCNFYSIEEESNFVAKKINELKLQGVNLKNVAILYRSNYLSRAYEQALIFYSIRYNLYGGFKFYQRSEIKDILAYLQSINNYDEMSLRRIINLPRRQISDNVVSLILKFSNHQNISFWNAIERHYEIVELTSLQHKSLDNFIELINDLKSQNINDIGNFFNYLLKKIDYITYIEKQDQQKVDSIKRNLEELKNSIINFKEQNLDNWSLTSYLHEIALYTTLDDKKKIDDAVTLSTIHSAKGLEYEYVFLVSFNNGVFPSNHSLETDQGLQEERRLAYVAITRAKRELYICTNEGYNYESKKTNEPSKFIYEINKESLIFPTKKIKKISDIDLNWYDSKNTTIKKDELYNNEQVNDYKIGDKVIHTIFGLGYVIDVIGDVLEISFAPPHKIKKIVYNHKSIKRKIE